MRLTPAEIHTIKSTAQAVLAQRGNLAFAVLVGSRAARQRHGSLSLAVSFKSPMPYTPTPLSLTH